MERTTAVEVLEGLTFLLRRVDASTQYRAPKISKSQIRVNHLSIYASTKGQIFDDKSVVPTLYELSELVSGILEKFKKSVLAETTAANPQQIG